MRRRAHDKVQGANPHRLTLWQHVFPAGSIARFAGPDGRVAVIDLVRRTAVPRACTVGSAAMSG